LRYHRDTLCTSVLKNAGDEERVSVTMAGREATYHVVVERDPESGWLVGEVVELPGCYTEAPDRESLEAAMREAIAAYLEAVTIDEPLPDYVETFPIVLAG
jgi:predicted RNase H-like HicB family nuclease